VELFYDRNLGTSVRWGPVNPSRIDSVVDLAYGGLILLSVVLIVTHGTAVGIAFGLGVLVASVVHVGWRMARFDPAWMTEAVTENIEETITEEVTETVGDEVTDEGTENVAVEVTESVEESLTEEIETLTGRSGRS